MFFSIGFNEKLRMIKQNRFLLARVAEILVPFSCLLLEMEEHLETCAATTVTSTESRPSLFQESTGTVTCLSTPRHVRELRLCPLAGMLSTISRKL